MRAGRRTIRLVSSVASAAFVASGLTASGLAATTAQASTTYVVNNTTSACSDSGPGTSAKPFCTIATAAKKALAGDTVVVSGGTYPGTGVNPANSGTTTSPITFTADAGVTISGGTKAFALSGRSNIVINGFTITGTSVYGISVSGGGNVVLSHNTVSFSGQPVSGKTASGIYLSNVAGGEVTGNITHDNSAHGIYLTGTTTGVTVEGNTSYHNAYQYQRIANGIYDVSSGNSIIGNVTYANENTGISVYPGANNTLIADNVTYDNGNHGIDNRNVTGGRVIGNTVYYNCTDGINVEGTSGNYVIENNIAENNATGAIINPTPINPPGAYTNDCNRRTGNIGVYDSAPATTTADYNLVWQTGTASDYVWAGNDYNSQATLNAATGQEAHGIFADPGFVNPATWDLQLTTGSPAIDSANTSAPGEQPTDIFGRSPYDDRGAYEFQSGTPSGPTAKLAVSPATGSTPLAVTADASASTPGTVPISSYSFDFGDGTTIGPQPGAVATHTYTTAGAYTVTVTVTDANGLTSTTTQSVTVQQGPTAHLTVSPTSGTVPLPVTADASASTAGNSPITSYTFDFGDGLTVGPQAGATANHTYAAAGVYTVAVTVTDANGLTSKATQTVTVTGAATAAYVNSIATNSSTSTHTSESVTVWRSTGVAAGDMIIAVVQLTGTSSTGAVTGTDSAGDTFNVASDISNGSGDRLVALYGLAKTGLGTGSLITVKFPSAASNRVTADEVSGVTTVDQAAAASGPSGSFSSGATGTTARAGEFVLGTAAVFGGTSVTWGSGWRVLTTYTTGTNALARAYQIPAGTGSFAATGTASGAWLSQVVTFK
jgi:parallel beta-helix repeat protein